MDKNSGFFDKTGTNKERHPLYPGCRSLFGETISTSQFYREIV